MILLLKIIGTLLCLLFGLITFVNSLECANEGDVGKAGLSIIVFSGYALAVVWIWVK